MSISPLQLRVGNVMLHRQQTAPSIPMPGRNYGYEEGEDGGLKPQVMAASDSSMGPAYYNVSHVSGDYLAITVETVMICLHVVCL